ncbi:MAG: membrane protein insertase YidC [Clostridia bacterium]|nr:membrane protein insertase YidC [Clostridia bacterium]
MSRIFDIINIPLGYVMRFLAQLFGGNFALSVFVFTLLIDVILIPLSIKSQKSTVAQLRIKPKLDELKKRYGDDKQKFAQAQQELYQKENVSMAGGCLPMLVRLLLLFAIYSLILSPLTYMSGASKTKVNNVSSAISSGLETLKEEDEDRYNEIIKEYNWTSTKGTVSNQLGLIKFVRDDTGIVKEILGEKKYAKIEDDYEYLRKKDKESNINYTLFTDKINLIEKPNFSMDIFHNFELNWLLPIGAFLSQMLMSLIQSRITKINTPEAPSMMGLTLFMPLISLFIGFTFPGGVCFYWICSSLIGGAIQVFVQLFYGPQRLLARERAKEIEKEYDFEKKQLEKYN